MTVTPTAEQGPQSPRCSRARERYDARPANRGRFRILLEQKLSQLWARVEPPYPIQGVPAFMRWVLSRAARLLIGLDQRSATGLHCKPDQMTGPESLRACLGIHRNRRVKALGL